jgi:hypothetical protein
MFSRMVVVKLQDPLVLPAQLATDNTGCLVLLPEANLLVLGVAALTAAEYLYLLFLEPDCVAVE